MEEKKEDIIHNVAQVPIEVGKRVIDSQKGGAEVAGKVTMETAKFVGNIPPLKQARKFWHGLGPGLTTGAADDDPSGIATYSHQGARYGFQLLWLSPLTFPFMAIVHETCA